MKVKKMRPLTHCDDCGSQIWATNVFKTVVIPGAVGHLALVFRCANCQKVGKAAASTEDWDKAQDIAALHDSNIEKIMVGAHIDVESIENVADLQAEWATLPPLREAIMYTCQCDDCKRKLYGK